MLPSGRSPEPTEAPTFKDPREAPAYTLAEAALYVKVPAATLRSWTVGREYPTSKGEGRSAAVIRLVKRKPPYLSFLNLIEAHVLRSLRTKHTVSLKAVRNALMYAESELGIDRLLLRKDLRTEGGRLFLSRYGQLINLSTSGQLALRQMLEEHLKRVEWDSKNFPIRLHPFLTSEGVQGRDVIIDPAVGFGRPVLKGSGVSTSIIVSRIDAGETAKSIARDYDLSVRDVEQAILYEQVA